MLFVSEELYNTKYVSFLTKKAVVRSYHNEYPKVPNSVRRYHAPDEELFLVYISINSSFLDPRLV